nr:MAG TPA: hypothetical protein [Caudoviricetes sp.]
MKLFRGSHVISFRSVHLYYSGIVYHCKALICASGK